MDVLGGILKKSDGLKEIVGELKPDAFYEPRHRIIYQAMINLFHKNKPVDVSTVSDELSRMGELEKNGGRLYLIDLLDGVASAVNVPAYAEVVIEKKQRRDIICVANEIMLDCYEYGGSERELSDLVENKVFKTCQRSRNSSFTPINEILPDTFQRLDKYVRAGGGLQGVSSGFSNIDNKLGGLLSGQYVVIAARPSMGKTSLGLNIAERCGVPVAFFSIEMKDEQLAMRLLCGKAGISRQELRRGQLRDEKWRQLIEASQQLEQLEIFINDSPYLTTLDIKAEARRLKSRYDIQLIIVDYLQLVKYPGRTESRNIEVASISADLKALAKELNLPVIALSQLSRMTERREDRRPQLSDLRDSGAIEQDADIVMLLYRPGEYMKHLDDDDKDKVRVGGETDLIIAKNRDGETGVVKLTFINKVARFEDCERREN
jgi:replicative DNA helicase